MKRIIMPISLDFLAQLILLPDGVSVTHANIDLQRNELQLVIEGEGLPAKYETPSGGKSMIVMPLYESCSYPRFKAWEDGV